MGFWNKADRFWRDPANLFGGREKEKAAKAQKKAQDENFAFQKDLYAQNKGEISGYGEKALGALGTTYGEQQGYYGKAGEQLGKSNQEAAGSLRGGYGQAREDLGQLSRLGRYGEMAVQGRIGENFAADPGYQFRLQQGNDALSRMQAAGGGRLSGAALKKMAEYNQGFASNEFGQAAQRDLAQRQMMANLGQIGYGAQNRLADMGYGYGQDLAGMQNQYGQNMANLYGSQGNAAMGYGQNQGGIYQNMMTGNLQNAGNLSGAYNTNAQYAGMVGQNAGNLKGQQASTAASILGGMFGGPAGAAAAGKVAGTQGGGNASWATSGGSNYRRVGSIG